MRSQRRSFAAPFVITMVGAAGSSGFTSCNPPRQTGPEPVIVTNPPPPPDPNAGSAGSGSAVDPGGPNPNGGYTTDNAPRPGETRWSIFKQGADCFAAIAVDCPKPATPGGPVPTCNPPPAMKYACPTGLSMDRPLEIARWQNDTTCHVVPEKMTCPAGAICNPPPLRAVDCPK